MKKVLCINTGGKGNLHGLRMRRLANKLNANVVYYDLDKSVPRWQASKDVWNLLNSSTWDLVYQEGTGIAAGVNLIRAAIACKQKFVVSSGDPIGGFFRITKGKLAGDFFELYEKLLYKNCAGFIGWTPYLTGVAIKMGAKRAVTVEGAVDLDLFYPKTPSERLAIREKYSIPQDHLVCGVVGSLIWTPRQSYCYGYELIKSLEYTQREDITVLIVGDGCGRKRLEDAIPDRLKSRVIFTGRLPEIEVVGIMNAMNIGFVTQTLDELGNFRLTTKLPEYLACGIPVAMSPIPGFYDYASTAGWALPAYHPASAEFHSSCAQWLNQLSWNEVLEKSDSAVEVARKYFDYNILSNRFCNFINNLLHC